MPVEPGIEEVFDNYLRETRQEFSVAAEATHPSIAVRREPTGRRRHRSGGARTRSSTYQVMRRNVRLSPYMTWVVASTMLTLTMWCAMLIFAFAVDTDSPFAGYTLDRRHQVLGLVCLLSVCFLALFVRAAWQIWSGTRRHREFPPRKPALLSPPAVLRGIDAERIGSHCLYAAFVLVTVSCVLFACTVSVILSGS